MKKCICGSTRFAARQRSYHDVVVDGNNNFLEDDGVTDSDTPYGPYSCYNCAREYNSLSELTEGSDTNNTNIK